MRKAAGILMLIVGIMGLLAGIASKDPSGAYIAWSGFVLAGGIFALYFGIPLKEVGLDKAEEIQKDCSKSQYYQLL